MASARLIWICVLALASLTSGVFAKQHDGLIPISPHEEQGRRAVLIHFGGANQEESLQQDEILPSPKFSEESANRQQSEGALDPTLDPAVDSGPNSLVGEPIRQRYPDGKVQVLRYVRQDEYGNYFNDGPWKLFNRTGQIMAEGQFQNGDMHGTWSRWHPINSEGIFRTKPFASQQGPFLSIASFSRGKLDGVWTIYDRSRRKIFEMQYVDGLRHGTATWWSNTGYLAREMHFDQGLPDGLAVDYDNGQKPITQTNFIQGRRVFSQIAYHEQKQKKSEDFYLDAKLALNGEDNWWDATPAEYARAGHPVRHGPANSWYENGQPRLEGNFNEGTRHGPFTGWHANGQKQLGGEFDHDQKTGSWIWWHESGMKAVQGQYAEDKPTGTWSWWDESGKVIRSGDVASGDINLQQPIEGDTPNLEPPTAEALEEITPKVPAPLGGS